jgi:hypothetical protein
MTAHMIAMRTDIGVCRSTDAAQIQQGHDCYKNRRQHRVRNEREKALDGECSVNAIHKWLDQVIKKHGPAREEAQMGVEPSPDVVYMRSPLRGRVSPSVHS